MFKKKNFQQVPKHMMIMLIWALRLRIEIKRPTWYNGYKNEVRMIRKQWGRYAADVRIDSWQIGCQRNCKYCNVATLGFARPASLNVVEYVVSTLPYQKFVPHKSYYDIIYHKYAVTNLSGARRPFKTFWRISILEKNAFKKITLFKCSNLFSFSFKIFKR